MDSLPTKIIEFDIQNVSAKELTLQELDIDPADNTKIYWIHCNLKNNNYKEIAKKLNLPKEVNKLVRKKDLFSTVTDENNALSIRFPAILNTQIIPHTDLDCENLIFHLTHKYCFTAAKKTPPALLEFANTFEKNIQYAKTPCFILFLICDNVINDYSKTIFNEEIITDELELHIRDVHKDSYQEVMEIKQQVMKIKRNVSTIREILLRISTRTLDVISEECKTSLHNLANHSHMIIHETDAIRDVLNGMLGQIDNTLMQELNETMRVLTAFAAIFLPLTLITGIYGMNFHSMPELEWKYGYYYSLALLLICGIGLFVFFKKKRWF